MKTLRSLLYGLQQAALSPGLLLLLWAVNLLVALPAAVWVAEEIRHDLGASRIQEDLRGGFDMTWYGEVQARSPALADRFGPARVLGAGPFLDNLDGWLQGRLFTEHPELVALAGLYGLLWIFLLGGVVDRLAHPGQAVLEGRFLGSCRRFWGPFLRLTLLSGGAYYLVYRLAAWSFEALWLRHRDTTRETTVLLQAAVVALAVAALLVAIRITFDYAKVALVTEDRRSALVGAWRGLRFTLRHPLLVVGVYGLPALAGLATVALYGRFGPASGNAATIPVLLAFGAGQLVLLVRLFLRLTTLAAEADAYQHRMSAGSRFSR